MVLCPCNNRIYTVLPFYLVGCPLKDPQNQKTIKDSDYRRGLMVNHKNTEKVLDKKMTKK